jgi:hypothetical protein
MEITDTATHMNSEFEDMKINNRYKVLGGDEYSVAIMIYGHLCLGKRLGI